MINNYEILISDLAERIFKDSWALSAIENGSNNSLSKNEDELENAWKKYLKLNHSFYIKSAITSFYVGESKITKDDKEFYTLLFNSDFNNRIYSVVNEKGTEFRLGDKVYVDNKRRYFVIEKFNISSSSIYPYKANFEHNIDVYVEEKLGEPFSLLDHINHYQSHLFITNDGVEVFADDIYWVYNIISKIQRPVTATNETLEEILNDMKNEWLTFSSEIALENYKNEHVYIYSYSDFADFINNHRQVGSENINVNVKFLLSELKVFLNKKNKK